MRYIREFETTASAREALRFATNFLHLPTWDPSISGARKLTRGRVGVGSRFLVRFEFLATSVDLTYEVAEFEPGKRAVLDCSTPWVSATDTIAVAPSAQGCTVRWDADIQIGYLPAPLDSPFAALFATNVEQAVSNLRTRLDELNGWKLRRTEPSRGAMAAQRRRAA